MYRIPCFSFASAKTRSKEADEEAFFRRYQECTEAILEIPYCRGFCYTQLTDIMQEINGLLTPERKAKIDVERFRSLNQDPVKI